MNKEIKELFNKYGVKDLKDKNGQSECYCCKNIKHKYSLTWTSFLYEYKEDYYCFDCLLTILLQKENKYLEHNWNELKKYIEDEIKSCKNGIEKLSDTKSSIISILQNKKKSYQDILDKMQELEEVSNE